MFFPETIQKAVTEMLRLFFYYFRKLRAHWGVPDYFAELQYLVTIFVDRLRMPSP